VFSDNAVRSGAALLRRLGLAVDSPELAEGAFCKYAYRLSEARHTQLFTAQRVMVPDFAKVFSLQEIRAFAGRHPEGFVVKPSREGNNRGVLMVQPGDDVGDAFAEVLPYLDGGVICEEIIPYRREFSFDGLGPLEFITEKISATGRYPVEIAQVLPAKVTKLERATLTRAGRLANWLVGQCDGPFHNEIKLSDDGTRSAVVEPNRRPAGMKIWSLARWVYGIDLYQRWVDAAFGAPPEPRQLEPSCSAATVMLDLPTHRHFSPDDVLSGADPFGETIAIAAARHNLRPDVLTIKEFSWLSGARRRLNSGPRDNGDFAAQGCVVMHSDDVDIREVVHTLRAVWVEVLDRRANSTSPATSHQLRVTGR